MFSRGVGVAVAAVATIAIGGVLWATSLTNPSAPLGASGSPSPTSSATRSPAQSSSPEPSTSAPVPSPEPTAFAWEPSQADWDQALAQARQLTVEQAAGQAIVASYSGTSPTKLTAFIEARDLGGVMLQGDATKSKKVTESLTKAANTAGGDRDWPVMVAVDQEGGTVARLRGMIPGMPAFMAAGATTDKAAVHEAYADQGWYVRDMGFNTNFAPDADVTVGLSDPVIRSRSAGSDAQNVAATVDAAVAGYTDAGVISTVKHFPGHGSVDVDSHKGLPVQAATVAQLEKRDFVPFASAIDAGVPSVMVGHIALHEWGDVPASVAPAAYAYLRDDLGFTGVAITDAMNMGAIVDQYEPGRATVLALEAGADLVLMPADVDAAISGIVAAVKSGELPRERLDEAVARSVLMMRWQAGLVPTSTDAPPAHYARDFAARAVTVVTPTCSGELVSDTVTVTGGWEHERTTLAAALAKRGIGAGDESHPGTTVRLAGNSSTEVEGDVVVALDGPWILDKSKATTYITLYGRSDDALEALADILVGKVTSGSSWPVTLKNVPGKPC